MIQVLCQKIPKDIFREQCHLIPQIQWSPHGFRALQHAVNDFSAKDCQLKGYKFTLYCVSFGRIAWWPSHIWPHQSEPCWKRRISCTIDRDLKHWIEVAKKTLSKFSRYRTHLLKHQNLNRKQPPSDSSKANRFFITPSSLTIWPGSKFGCQVRTTTI